MNIKNNIIFHFTFFAALLFLAKPAQALPTQDSLFRPNHYSFDITNTFYPAQKVLMPAGDASMAFKPAVFLQAGFTYSRFWKNGLGVKVGGRWGIIPLAVKFNYPSSYQGGGSPGPFYFYNYLQFPLCAAYRIRFKKDFNLEFSTGIALELVFPFDGVIGLGTSSGNDLWDLYVEDDSKPAYFDIPFEITASKVFNHKHELDFGLTYSLPVSAVGNGHYEFNLPGYGSSSGSFNVRNTYVGIKVGYTFLAKPRFGEGTKASARLKQMRVDDVYYQPGISKEPAPEVVDTALQAQQKPPADTSFRPNHFSIDIITTFYPAPGGYTPTGEPLNLLNPSVFVSAGVAYSRFWRNGAGLKLGSRWGFIPIAPKDNKPFDQVYFYNYLQFSACAAYRLHFKKNFNLDFSTGIAFDVMFPISTGAYFGYINANGFENIDVSVASQSNVVFVDVPFEIIASKVFRGKDELDFGLSCLMPFRAVGYGQITNYTLGSGTFAVKNEYIGIKVGYTFLGKAWFKKHNKKA